MFRITNNNIGNGNNSNFIWNNNTIGLDSHYDFVDIYIKTSVFETHYSIEDVTVILRLPSTLCFISAYDAQFTIDLTDCVPAPPLSPEDDTVIAAQTQEGTCVYISVPCAA